MSGFKDNAAVWIVGAGSLAPEDLCFEKPAGDLIIAADAGYERLREAGIRPDLLIGDFDSMERPDYDGEVIVLPVVKDDTDTAFAVKEGLRRGYRQFVIFGGLGGKRLSHTIANIQLLTYLRTKHAFGELRFGETRVTLLVQGDECRFGAAERATLSLLSVSDRAVVDLRGLYYAGEQIVIRKSFPLGVSNHLTGREASITVERGKVLLIREAEDGAVR
ncbi:MAG: thiamine diphosphokinase [Lachnospiraceae bacterium]|nr:thiamine diphosphokinase [Lachnospiraceae bacterium]